MDNALKPIHPREYLAEILEEIGMSQADFAKRLGIHPMRICHIINGKRSTTALTACLISKAFHQFPRYWLNLQNDYDLELAAIKSAEKFKSVTEITNLGNFSYA